MRFPTEEAARKFIKDNDLHVTEEIEYLRGPRFNVVGACVVRTAQGERLELPDRARTLTVNHAVAHGTPVSRRVLKRSLTPQDR